ncbi:polyprenol monophosphomannose synthase [Caproiciproducens sp. NJN-50]|nr:polyprenol monophosphomannose synthase [Caproiciproducens sp. NJN-50]
MSVVVPVRNEAENIAPLLSEISKALEGISFEVIFVDDSTDGTPEIIQKEAMRSRAPVRMEHREGQSGLSSAVLRGFELAEGDFVAVMDADLQHPPTMLRSMYCAMLHGADLCLPSRRIPGGGDPGLKGSRKFVSSTAAWMGKVMVARLRPLSDPTGGLFMVRRPLLEGAGLKPIGWKILAEVAAVCPCEKIIEIPYVFQKRNSGTSKISLKVTLEYIGQLVSLLTRARKGGRFRVERWSEQQVTESLEELKGAQNSEEEVSR